MISEKNLSELIEKFNSEGRTATFAEFIAVAFKDKCVELYLGDSYEDVSIDQISTSYPAVFCGKVIAAYKECLILNSIYTKNNKLVPGNILFINERSIRALNEIDGNGVMEDMFLRSKESLDIPEFYGQKIK